MKLVKLETFTTPFVSFVRATSETGATGWGQLSTYHADITAQIARAKLLSVDAKQLGERIEAARHELAIIGEQGDSVGRAQEQIGGEAARRQDGGHALGGERLIAQEAEVPRRGAEVIAHAAEAQQRGVRIGAVSEPAEEDREEGALDRGPARHP